MAGGHLCKNDLLCSYTHILLDLFVFLPFVFQLLFQLPLVSLKTLSRPGDICHYLLQSFVSNNCTHSQKMNQSNLFSSTPFSGHSKSSLKNNHISSERQMYQRLLDKASSSETSVPKPSANLCGTITINLDDEEKDQRSSLLRQCNLSPILPHSRIQTINHTSTKNRNLFVASPDTRDSKARAWLENCSESPYLSDKWLNNLTSSYQAKKKILERDCELAKANIRFWEKQRILAEKERIDNLEQRLACLLRTPPILKDPYLAPEPIPIELPYKPVKVKEPKVPSLPVLTASQIAQTEAALRTGSPDEVLVDKFKLVVTRRELMTLTGTNWLSDMVINFYLQLLQHRSQRQTNLPRIAVLSTFFYAKLTAATGGGYSGVRRWTRQIQLFDQDIILIPIHDRGMHWCLSCVDLRAKSITYYDSMGSGNMKCLKQLMDYLKNESLDKRNTELPDPDSWKFVNTEDTVPQQYNGSDCGVFLCTFSEFLSRGASFTFSQSNTELGSTSLSYFVISLCNFKRTRSYQVICRTFLS
ncbi:Sentrin-specific protease 1 [Schistosoma japonicum]|nr:Sentrin-specific protease 1 [Schistosoma japonicum]